MNKIVNFILILAAFAVLSASCEKQLLEKDPINSPVNNFEYLWQDVKNKHSYFEYKSVDWNEVYNNYRPLIQGDMDDKELFAVLADML
ncbi:MAG TPA: peptidase S41, partial [Mariniphaga anaerophila]|nr:peptidase S41 [Mariniphaga anaerophila]